MYLYSKWLLQSFSLFRVIEPPKSVIIIGYLLMIALLQRRGVVKAVLLVAWVIIGVAPALLIVDHAYSYYLVYVLPAFILLFLQSLQIMLEWFRCSRKIIVSVIVLFILVNTGLSSHLFSQLDEDGLLTPPVEGWNNLIRKSILVSMTKEFLLENFSPLPPGTCLVFDKRLIGPICNGAGPKLWLGDSSLNVLDVGQVKMDSHGVYLTPDGLTTPNENAGTTSPRKYLEPRRTFFIIVYQTPTGQFYLSKSQPPIR